MCGICGEVRFDGTSADVAAVDRMAQRLASRGPDGAGTWARDGVALGHRRLSVIDLSANGAQPMSDAELGLTIVFNGCIYNHRELREELARAGYRFFSTSDTEVLLKGWHAWGTDLLGRLAGMFAFVIVERDTGRTVLTRDHLGIKPLYVAERGGRLRFASSLPALVAAGDTDTSIDPVALHHYLTFHSVVPAPRTILTGVAKVPPATVIEIEPDGRRTERVWWEPSFDRDPDLADWAFGDWVDAVEGTLRRAVERRLVSDVPVGVLLSGGLDSSLVVGLLAEAGQADLATFSIGFEPVGGEQGDEFAYSDVIARSFGTDHHQLRVGADRMLPALTEAIAAMSEPMVSHDAVAFYLLSAEVARHVKVVQSGQGADEVFGGYHWYPPMFDSTPEAALGRYAEVFFDRPHADMTRLVAPEHRIERDASRELVADHFAKPGAASAIDRTLRLDTQVMLVDDPVKRVDTMTMAWGLEARVPFLDGDLVELAGACPPEHKLAEGGKGVLKEVARRVIPDEVIDRPKGYFPVPALKYLEGAYLDEVAAALRSDTARARGLFNASEVDRLLATPNEELTPLRGNKLWQLGLLELWLDAQGIGP